VEFEILGPLAVWKDGSQLSVGAGRQRALLALLLLRRREQVSTARLVDELWGPRPPATALKALRVHVSQLRKQLGPDVIETRPGGYALRIAPGAVDADRFEEAVAEAGRLLRMQRPGDAVDELRAALSLWRGHPLPELRDTDAAGPEIARLAELRLVGIEYRLEAELELGLEAEVVPEIEALVREHPLRERLRGLQMLALYRVGRQADALAAYQAARRTLVEELGLEPGQELRRLEAEILRHDPVLARRGAAEIVPVASRRPIARRRLAAAAAVVAGVAVAAFLVLDGTGGGSKVPSSGDAVAVVGLQSGRPAAAIPVAAAPSAIAAADGSLWVANVDDATVSRIDPRRGTVVQTLKVGQGPDAVAAGDGFVWVSNGLDGTVTKIDPAVDQVVDTIDVGNEPAGIAVGPTAVWVASSSDGSVTRIAVRTDRALRPLAVAGSADGIALAFGSAWVTSEADQSVTRLDAGTGAVIQRIPAGGGASAVMAGFGSVWVANTFDDTLTRIDPASDTVRAVIPVGDGPDGLAIANGAVWVSNQLSGTLTKIDPATGASVRSVEVGSTPEGVAAAGGRLFAAVRGSGAGHRGGTLSVLEAVDGPDAVDPAVAYNKSSWRMLALTNDGLTGFRRVGGSAGTLVVPDLALSVPTPTDGGRTYSFRLRPGLRYSNGAVVRAGDIRRGIERALRVPSGAGAYLSAIVGAGACRAAPESPCELSRGVVVHGRTITFHLSRPDSDFLYELALPPAYAVPAGFPVRPQRPVPATGPYEIAAFDPEHEIRLVRNPWFREWSPAAQPAGYPDAIVERVTPSADANAAAVVAGRADVAAGLLSSAVLESLRTHHARLLHVDPWSITFFLVLDTLRPPFDDVRVRRALNYAVDRRRLVELTLGAGLGSVTCQVLPSNFDGFRRYCPYGADMARARALVAASGTSGRAITVTMPSWIGFGTAAGRYVVSVLDRLGYRAHLKLDKNPYFGPQVRQLQIGFDGWIPNFAAAAEFFAPELTCRTARFSRSDNAAAFCNPAIDREIVRAQTVETTDAEHAARLWAAVDRAVVDQAPWVPFANGSSVAVVSARVGDYEYNPQWGTLLDQLWVR
jgi:YVTN family beta-propeller protein